MCAPIPAAGEAPQILVMPALSAPGYVAIWQRGDLVIVGRDQAEALVERIQAAFAQEQEAA